MICEESSETESQSKLRNDKRSEVEYIYEIEVVVAYS